LNLPRINDPGMDTVAPQQGGPSDASVGPPPAIPTKPRLKLVPSGADVAGVIAAHRTRQADWLQKVPVGARPAAFRHELNRWTRELADDLGALSGLDEAWFAGLVTAETLGRLEQEATEAPS
jgi:hypothetical protein